VTGDEELEPTAQQIAQRGRLEVVARLREAFIHEAASTEQVQLEPMELEQLVAAATERAGAALWRRSLAAAASEVLGVALPDAIEHPAVRRAHELVGAPAYPPPEDVAPPLPSPGIPRAGVAPPPSIGALRMPAVHQEGIEALRSGERDLELRISADGVDVLKASTGATIGRLRWEEITEVRLERPRRSLRRRGQEMHVLTRRGRASFGLPDLTEDQRREHLEPLLAALGHGAASESDDGAAPAG
jgi:hypothetical protein